MGGRNIDILLELDKGEENRKADYTIWGYLYQFDLMLLDMLNQNTEEDNFGDKFNAIDAEYEVEMVEDYAKRFVVDEKQYIRISQIKYHSQSDEFKDKQAMILLYYAYLKYLALNDENSEFKCALYYYNQNNESWSAERIKEFLESSLKKFMEEDEAKKEIASDEEKKSTMGNKKDDALTARVKRIIGNNSCPKNIDKFANEVAIVKWTDERQELIRGIKERLVLKHPNDFNNYLEKKGDILYSLYIDYIINTWQRKKKRNERKKIKLSDIERRIGVLIHNEDITCYQSIINSIRDAIFAVLKDIKENLLNKHPESEVEAMIKRYKLIGEVLYENINSKFQSKEYRFSFLNTVNLNEFCEYQEYVNYRAETEYDIFLINNVHIRNYIIRAMKFMYYYIGNTPGYRLDFNDWFFIDEDFWQFKNPDDKRTIILFPKPYNFPLQSHNRFLQRLNRSKIRPQVWYFGQVDSNGIYDLEVIKPGEHKQVQVDKPNRNRSFRVGCMGCLKETEPINFKKIKFIYEDRCVEDDD